MSNKLESFCEWAEDNFDCVAMISEVENEDERVFIYPSDEVEYGSILERMKKSNSWKVSHDESNSEPPSYMAFEVF